MTWSAMRLPVFFRCRSSRLYILLLTAFFLLILFNGGFLFTLPTSYRRSESHEIKEKLRLLGEEYVKTLSDEQVNVQDGPYTGITTYYDLKKTFAVLLESIIHRLNRLEMVLGMINGSAKVDKSFIDARRLLSGAQEKCDLPPTLNHTHPSCEEKINWMNTFWKTDPCYAQYHVDGTRCSFIIYLSEVEKFCPRLTWRPTVASTVFPGDKKANYQFNVEGLFYLMNDNPTNFQWIKMRIERLWPQWVTAYKSLADKQNYTLNMRAKRKIFLHLGFLTKESGFKFGEKSLKGGPLGELVQWSDLIACLYILGHELIISSEINTFRSYAQADATLKSSCPVLEANRLDVIFTDIVGMKQIKKKIPASLQNYKCRLRVLDSFGTHAEFNSINYFLANKEILGGQKKDPWGGHLLNLQQFYNMYPHTPDNTFLGFVVETYFNKSYYEAVKPKKNNWALIYGKESYMWKGAEAYIKTIADSMEVHATVAESDVTLPAYVINHGVLSGLELHKLLRKVKLFVGLGFPYEGPAPLEAIANGAIFLNPRFDPPKGRLTDAFFADKPTLRQLSSQNPYAEDFIGEPHVITINITDLEAVNRAILNAQTSEVDPFLPFEFTHEGMLERVNVLVTHQDFCDTENYNWPPFSACRIILSEQGQSCKDACWKQNFICERSYFPKINNVDNLARFGECHSTEIVAEMDAPSMDRTETTGKTCRIQSDPLLFSCAWQKKNFSSLLFVKFPMLQDAAAVVDRDPSLFSATPLHLLAGNPSLYSYAAAQILLSNGADPNRRNDEKLTPVHVAAAWGNYEQLKLLLFNGGDPTLLDDEGKSAVDLAFEEHQTECWQLMQWWTCCHSDGTSPSPKNIISPRAGNTQNSYSPKFFASPRKYLSHKNLTSSQQISASTLKTQFDSGQCTEPSLDFRYFTHDNVATASKSALPHSQEIVSPKNETFDISLIISPLKGEVAPKVGSNFDLAQPTELSESFKTCQSVQCCSKTISDGPKNIEPSMAEKLPQISTLQLTDQHSTPSPGGQIKKAGHWLYQNLFKHAKMSIDQKSSKTQIVESGPTADLLLNASVARCRQDEEQLDAAALDVARRLDDAELRRRLLSLHDDVGPVNAATRRIYERRLAQHLTDGLRDQAPTSPNGSSRPRFSLELNGFLSGTADSSEVCKDEADMCKFFENPAKKWREGAIKMSFCYLLLDPEKLESTVTELVESQGSENLEMRKFMEAIFYVGKGKKSRPLQHLFEASRFADSTDKPMISSKVKKILELWKNGSGVVSLHIFHNLIAAEAYSREAAMIDALGLQNLTNVKRGDYYGLPTDWTTQRRRRLGAFLLTRAFGICKLERTVALKLADVLNIFQN